MLWLDCDREGENIAFEVIDICTAVNQHLTIKRARFSALIERSLAIFILQSPSFVSSNFHSPISKFHASGIYGYMTCYTLHAREIHESVQNLVEPNRWFADAVDARQVGTFPQLGLLRLTIL